jgi:hypothetical protein
MDGLSHSELVWQLAHNRDAIPNLARLIGAGAMLSHGSIVNFPSITWPSHSTILTGTWSGHHDIVNPTFHVRESRQTIPVQGNIFETEGYLNPEVETLYEAFRRVRGPKTVTASIHEPQGRGADHAVFERRIVGDKARLRDITRTMMDDVSPRWMADQKPAMHREEVVDIRGMAQLAAMLEHLDGRVPDFVAHEFVLTDGAGHDYGPHHEGLREALYRTDARIGKVLELLAERGAIDSTLFVITSDHGMAPQRIELAANPTVEPSRHGIKGVFAEPMIYLRDLAVECARARDRTLRVIVLDNDLVTSGTDLQVRGSEHPPVEGVTVKLEHDGRVIGESTTSASGAVAFPTPANLRDDQLVVRIDHPEFNSRSVRADGRPITIDLRKHLYG